MKVKTSTIVRCVLLVLAIANLFLSSFGIVPEDIVGESNVYQIASNVIAAIMAAWTAWKNNSFTGAAIKADEFLEALKSGGVGEDESSTEG